MKEPHRLRPGNRYLRDAEARRTLGDLMKSKTAVVAICRRCKHRRLLFPASLAERLGASFKVGGVDEAAALRGVPRLRHRQCP